MRCQNIHRFMQQRPDGILMSDFLVNGVLQPFIACATKGCRNCHDATARVLKWFPGDEIAGRSIRRSAAALPASRRQCV
jgi:hypothetical protein